MADYPDNLNSDDFPLRFRTSICEIEGREVSMRFKRYDIRKASEELIASRSGDALANRIACLKVASLGARARTGDRAVYIICPTSDQASKIGIAFDPLDRLRQLQGGCHEQLCIRHLFWLPERQAVGLERLTLRVVSQMHRRLKGEWVDLEPADLAATVATILKANESTQVSDSEMQMDNLFAMLNLDAGPDNSYAYSIGCNPEKILMRGA